jgi:hypothetical protein
MPRGRYIPQSVVRNPAARKAKVHVVIPGVPLSLLLSIWAQSTCSMEGSVAVRDAPYLCCRQSMASRGLAGPAILDLESSSWPTVGTALVTYVVDDGVD